MGMVARECNRAILEDALWCVDELRFPVMRQLTFGGIRVYLDPSDVRTFRHHAIGF